MLLMLLPTVLALGEPLTNLRQPFGPLMCQQLCQKTTDCSSFYFSASLLSCQLRDKRCHVMSAPYTLHVLHKTSTSTCPPTTKPRCVESRPKGYSTLKYGNKVVFTKLKRRNSSWKEALQSCQKDGGGLIQPKTKAYEKSILKKYPQFGSKRIIKQAVWIGMVDDPDIDNFHWVDGDFPTYDSWGPGDPSHKFRNQKENCGMYRAGKWFDATCDTKNQFLCEICLVP